MAQVTLQAVVNFEQVNQLQQRIDKLNGQKITIGVQDFSKQLQDADKSLSSVNDNLTKTVRVFGADGKLTKGVDEYERGIATTVQVTHKLNEETGNLEQTQTRVTRNLKKEQREAAKAQEEHTEEVKKGSQELKKQGLLYDILGRSVSSFLARMAAYRAVYAGIRAITNGFKEAIETLKAVDDELVTVRKVTGFDAAQMSNVESQAYAVASKYGASAADYTSSVAAFARAGYKEVSTDLAELAEKTKIVGDTTADVAQQFLLSVDAAYKYRGDIEKLSAVLDGMNEIDNRFATSIERIAEGMGIVAPVAAQMNVSVDELAAGIGTITAVTQRSGTEAARALRAIFLNIVGDTKTEIDEGVTWTTGEIAGLRDVIRLYAKDAYDAAQASGEVIDPMRAIAGLAQSVKDGVLSEAQLTEMVSDIGGKLRTSQLLAIVNNWDMYENMLQTYRSAYGSADKEIDNAMDSWTRKTNVLKNTWTEFVKTGLNSNAVKDALDLLTGFIQRLDSLPAVLTRITMIVVGLRATKIVDGLQKAKDKVVDLFAAVKNGAMAAQSAAGIVGIAFAAIAAAWAGISFAVENYKRAQEEARQAAAEAIKTTKDDITTLDDLKKRYESIISSTADEATKNKELAEYKKQLVDVYGFEKDAVAGVNAERQTGLDLLNKEAEASLRRTLSENQDVFEQAGERYRGERRITNNVDITGLSGSFDDLASAGAYYTDAGDGMGYLTVKGNNLRDTYEKLSSVIDVLEKKQLSRNGITEEEELLLDNLRAQYADLGKEMEEWGSIYEDNVELMAQYNLMMAGVSSVTVDSEDAFDGLKRSLKEVYGSDKEVWEVMNSLINEMFPDYASGANRAAEATDALENSVEAETNSLFANQEALDANATAEERLAAAKKDAEAAARRLIPALFDESGQLTATGRAALQADSNLASLVYSELQAQQVAQQANFSSVIAQIALIGDTAAMTTVQLANMASVFGLDWSDPISKAQLDGMKRTAQAKGTSTQAQIMSWAQSYMRSIGKTTTGQIAAVSPYVPSGGGSSSSGGSGGYGGGHGGGSGAGSSSSSNEDKKLTALQDRVKLLKSELSLMQERGDSEEDQIAKMREIQEALRKEYEYLESIKGDQTTINNLYQEWYGYANQISDLEKQAADEAQKHADAIQAAVEAQKALDNLLKNRSVRVYNAAAGQWEWQADPSAVASAQSDLNNAISSAGYTQDAWALLYSAISGMASIKDNWLNSGPHAISNAFGGNSYGNTYNFGSIRLSEAQAQSMTVAEFAKLANALPAFNNSP